jgi:hypothetical protein
MAAPAPEIDLKKPEPVADVPKEEEKGLTNDMCVLTALGTLHMPEMAY